jgi:hypothetical protein
MECIRLRVKDLELDQRQIVVRDGKGMKDRVTMLPMKDRVTMLPMRWWHLHPSLTRLGQGAD